MANVIKGGDVGRPNFEKLEVYQLSEKLADEIWHIVKGWDYFAKDTLGKQIVRSADSITANTAVPAVMRYTHLSINPRRDLGLA